MKAAWCYSAKLRHQKEERRTKWLLVPRGDYNIWPKDKSPVQSSLTSEERRQHFQWLWQNFPVVRSHQMIFHHLGGLTLRARLYDNINILAAVKLTSAWWGLSKHAAQSAEGLTTGTSSLLLLRLLRATLKTFFFFSKITTKTFFPPNYWKKRRNFSHFFFCSETLTAAGRQLVPLPNFKWSPW